MVNVGRTRPNPTNVKFKKIGFRNLDFIDYRKNIVSDETEIFSEQLNSFLLDSPKHINPAKHPNT